MNTEDMKKLAIAGAVLFAAFKFGPAWAKAGALAVAAGIVGKRSIKRIESFAMPFFIYEPKVFWLNFFLRPMTE